MIFCAWNCGPICPRRNRPNKPRENDSEQRQQVGVARNNRESHGPMHEIYMQRAALEMGELHLNRLQEPQPSNPTGRNNRGVLKQGTSPGADAFTISVGVL